MAIVATIENWRWEFRIPMRRYSYMRRECESVVQSFARMLSFLEWCDWQCLPHSGPISLAARPSDGNIRVLPIVLNAFGPVLRLHFLQVLEIFVLRFAYQPMQVRSRVTRRCQSFCSSEPYQIQSKVYSRTSIERGEMYEDLLAKNSILTTQH